ncbi:MAG: biopolymer transporter ExbD [Verrucomicrobiota bacterium]
MARNFRRPRSAQPIAELNVTNLIDLGFMLLIIFMIATPLINQNEQSMQVNLPVVDKLPQAQPDPNQIFENLTVKADGSISLGSRMLTLAQLSRELAMLAAQPKPPVIRLRGEATTPWQKMAQIWAELEKNKLHSISVDTQTSR